MNLNYDVVQHCLRLGSLHQLHSGSSCSLVRHNDCLHLPSPFVEESAPFCREWRRENDPVTLSETLKTANGRFPPITAANDPFRSLGFLVTADPRKGCG